MIECTLQNQEQPGKIFSFESIIFLFVLVILGCDSSDKPPELQNTTWRNYGGGSDQSKHVVQDQITKENVSQLELAWAYETGNERSYAMNPIIVDSVMYVFAKNSSLVALNATNGKELWIHVELN